jgi:hypothetical protein
MQDTEKMSGPELASKNKEALEKFSQEYFNMSYNEVLKKMGKEEIERKLQEQTKEFNKIQQQPQAQMQTQQKYTKAKGGKVKKNYANGGTIRKPSRAK